MFGHHEHWHTMGRGGPRDRGGHGPGGFGRHGGGGGSPFRRFPKEFFSSGGRARRGNIRAAVLALLAEEPRNGYQIMQQIEERSQGAWRPSSGSVYPILQQLEDEGLASTNGRTYELTEKGRAYVKANPDEMRAPWQIEEGDPREQVIAFRHLIVEVVSAVKQVAVSGNAAQLTAAKKILSDAKRALYRLLAEDDEED
jgi:DNA-binding PadR family transcriptional regulator